MQALYLVTGGCGFIGSCFVLRARAAGIPVIDLDKLTYCGNPENLAPLDHDPGHVLVQGDIANRELVAYLLRTHRPSAIVHFAAESHVDRSISDPGVFVRTNVMGTANLLHCALDYWQGLAGQEKQDFRFLHVSTDEVFGSLGPDDAPFREDTPYAPNSPYSASKAASDHLARAFCHTYGLPVLVTNCSNNYGPRQFPEKLIPLFISRALAGEPMPLYGSGRNVRDWLYVEEHCEALERVLGHGLPGRSYNIGGNCERSNLELVDSLCRALDSERPRPAGSYRELVRRVADRPGHDWRYAMDTACGTSLAGSRVWGWRKACSVPCAGIWNMKAGWSGPASARPDKIFPVAVHRERHAARTGWPLSRPVPDGVRPAAPVAYRRVSVRGISACRRQGAGMLPAAPLTSHIFRLSHAACCITFRSRGVMRQHTGTTSYAAGRVFGTAVSLPAGLEDARRSMCPGCSRRLRRDAAQPQGRFSGLQGYRGLVMPGPCMPHGGRGEEWPPCLFAQQPNAASVPDDGPAGPFLANEAPS